ncbi:thermonuclease family protein [Gorillibacterium sp. sgz5001074]|uniref:thermonuclease family protein n=1 Tax=Gorillibacterium sp. sgz5001074 TaxID=3446695 RepID=UPI003F67337E
MIFKKAGLALLIALAMTATACTTSVSPPSSGRKPAYASAILEAYPDLNGHTPETYVVKRVVDGDTLETATKERIRLIGVDTPETVKPGSPVEAYGKEASDYAKSRLTGKTILAYADAEDKDKYGRLLRYIFIQGETRMFNEELIAEGYANLMTVPPNVMYSKQFQKLEREARSGKKGLWAAQQATK